jgi:predicted Zn finger-like uncharacterized protein
MSLIARCPACATLFRVVPDQLKISDGWVRCGQCSEVFDANQTLQAAPTVNTSESEPSQINQAPAEDALAGSAPQAEHESERELEPAPQPEPEPEPEPVLEHEPAVGAETALEVAAQGHEVPMTSEPVLEPGPLHGDVTEAALSVEPVSESAPDALPDAIPDGKPAVGEAEEALVENAPPLQDMAFVRQARRRAFWRRRGVRIALSVAACSLGLLLAGQVAFHHRDRLVSQVPALRPVLEALCASPRCRLGPPRRIEAIAIESSAFTRLRADAFRLSLTLSNQADIALAMPALELTLTDLQDQPVLRRVLQPADLGPQAPQSIEGRTEWTSTLTLAIAPSANPARIVGYRVLAFYP